MFKSTYLVALLLLFTTALSAQNQSFEGYIEAGDAAMEIDDYYNAYRLYDIAASEDWKNASKYDELIGDVYYKAGYAAYKSTAYIAAEQYFLRVLNNPIVSSRPYTRYFLGQSLFNQGRYEAAAAEFEAFVKEQPNAGDSYLSTAKRQIENAGTALEYEDKYDAREDKPSFANLGNDVNTEVNEISYIRGPAGQRYFTSNRTEWKNDPIKSNRYLHRIMVMDEGGEAREMSKAINLPGKNVALPAFTPDMKTVFYSVCDFVGETDSLRCDLYTASVSADGTWSNPQMLDINLPGYTTTQASVGADGDSGDLYLYFSSDRPGGLGMMDIYRAPLTGNKAGQPSNVTAVNTTGNEISPFFYTPRQTLYYSTDGKFTFGGLDVYRSYRKRDGNFGEPSNLGLPINSPTDDAYYTSYEDISMGYVASRRLDKGAQPFTVEGEENVDGIVCCYDLYEFPIDERIELIARTFNKLNSADLGGATVALYKITSTGPELVEEITNPSSDNEFNFLVDPQAKYELRATKNGFTQDLDEFDLNAPEFEGVSLIERELYLAPAVALDVFTFNNVDDSELSGVTVELFEVGPNGRETLVEEVTNAAGNDSHFLLEIGKKYRVVGTRTDYGTDDAEIDLTDYDPNSGSATITRNLYMGQALLVYVYDAFTGETLPNATVAITKPNGRQLPNDRRTQDGEGWRYTVNLNETFGADASHPGYNSESFDLEFTQQDVIDAGGVLEFRIPLEPNTLQPFEVYFDNDHPNPRSTRRTTNLTYEETYYPYVERKDVFKARASQDFESQQAFLVRQDMDIFFEQEVEMGWKQLRNFARVALAYLQEGNTLEVELVATASPRAATEYNRILTMRRNASIKNYLREYEGGALAPFLSSGQFKITERALGESTANMEKIYSRLDQERESIYSIRASTERRVRLNLINPARK